MSPGGPAIIDHLLDAETVLCQLHERLSAAAELAEATGSPLADPLRACLRDVLLAKRCLAGELAAQQEMAFA